MDRSRVLLYAVPRPGVSLESLEKDIGAVVAETFAQAEEAVRLIDVEWDELEPLLAADEAVRQDSLVAETRRYERGDYEAGLSMADAVVIGYTQADPSCARRGVGRRGGRVAPRSTSKPCMDLTG